MNIGVFSGSFNPIHMGHVMLGNYITEFYDIDQIWFLVTPQNPLKENKELLDQDQRFIMTQKALKNFDKLIASNFEFSLPKPSYTIHTLQKLKEIYPQHNFNLIIGADNWYYFDKWRDSDQILNEFKVYVYPRLGFPINIEDYLQDKIIELNSPIVEISSTFIRDSIKNKKDVQSFLPEAVYKYIRNKNLYI